METIPDYLTLYDGDATQSGSTLTWNIPDSYYTNTRGSICYVSLVQSIVQSNQVNDNLVIKYSNGVQNQYTSKRDGAVIAMMGVQTGTAFGTTNELNCYTPTITEPIKCLVSARPSQIVIDIREIDDNAIDTTAGTFYGVFTLKFEYLDPNVEIKNLKKQHYLSL